MSLERPWTRCSGALKGDFMLLLKTKALTKSFSSLFAIDDLNLTVEEGSIHSIIGPKGAGKTTLFSFSYDYISNLKLDCNVLYKAPIKRELLIWGFKEHVYHHRRGLWHH